MLHSKPITFYNVYCNKFIGAHGLFRPCFEGKMSTNPQVTMHLVQAFFVQGLQPRCIHEFMDRERDIGSLTNRRKRFKKILTITIVDEAITLPVPHMSQIIISLLKVLELMRCHHHDSPPHFKLLDSDSSINAVPLGDFLTYYHLSSGSLTAAN